VKRKVSQGLSAPLLPLLLPPLMGGFSGSMMRK
jgi:hypothetical protein